MLCECGCGEETKKNTQTKKDNRYINYHNGRHSFKGKKHSEETKKKMKGRVLSEETRAKIGNKNRGKKHSEETKKRMSETRKGRKLRPRKNIKIKEIIDCKCGCGIKAKPGREYIFGHQRIGRIHSEDTKTKTGVSTKQPRWSDERKRKFSIIKTGYKASDETKRKMSEAWTLERKENQSYAYSGEGGNNWQGGISFEPYPIEFNNILKRKIKKRDNNKCKNPNCWEKSKRICIHHIDYNKDNCSNENLITLCTSCNARANFNRNDWTILYNNILLNVA